MTNHSNHHQQTTISLSNLQNYIRETGMLKLVINFLTRTIAGPKFYIDHPNMFPQFIRISEYPHLLSVCVSQCMHSMFDISSGIHRMGRDDNQLTTQGRSENPISIIPSELQSKIHFEKVSYADKNN